MWHWQLASYWIPCTGKRQKGAYGLLHDSDPLSFESSLFVLSLPVPPRLYSPLGPPSFWILNYTPSVLNYTPSFLLNYIPFSHVRFVVHSSGKALQGLLDDMAKQSFLNGKARAVLSDTLGGLTGNVRESLRRTRAPRSENSERMKSELNLFLKCKIFGTKALREHTKMEQLFLVTSLTR